ncbi:hypothetical protein [Nocardioides sp. AX2bis]|uniref:hypothetical protein n=1 Tax=Nocardioides sp. AX2bis TaxID=2653157 RepID=UPI0012F0A543|nr:hypothetical protein [Nocardioides sp. AX2bis]VXB27921.1 conserved hypothetical protein [Nocardioides sp. AX2bis]
MTATPQRAVQGPAQRRTQRLAFTGTITGAGSTSGTRVVVGHWRRSPLGAFADAMVETAEGHRVLVAPRQDVADLVAATYSFDEVRVEPVECVAVPTWLTFSSTSLRLSVGVGRRTPTGWALRAVPRPVAVAPAWTLVTDPAARLLQRGVRTRGRAGAGPEARREWYGATDHHRVHALAGWWEDAPLGSLADVSPPTSFGFSSSPAAPSRTELVSTIEL